MLLVQNGFYKPAAHCRHSIARHLLVSGNDYFNAEDAFLLRIRPARDFTSEEKDL